MSDEITTVITKKLLTNYDGEVIYPYTSLDCIYDKDGNIISDILQSGTSTTLNIAVPSTSWISTSFPYTATIAHNLNGEPTESPTVDIDMSSYTTQDEVDAAENAWANIYRITFDATNMTLYAKEKPEINLTVRIKAVV